MRILMVGTSGQLGQSLSVTSFGNNCTLIKAGRADLDITRRDEVERRLADAGCRLVINAAAFTAVDQAEAEPEAAMAVNRDGVVNLAECCARLGMALIHLSTDYVFDGLSSRPYGEDDPVAPLSVYGASKAAGEAELRGRLAEHVILRVSWLYGGEGRNFVRSIASAILQGRPLRVVDDQFGALTHVDNVAAAIAAMAQRVADGRMDWGTYHYAARGTATWYQVASRMLALMVEWGCKPVPIEAVGSADYPLPARRPTNSQLDCSKFDRLIGLARPDWSEPLTPALRRILERA